MKLIALDHDDLSIVSAHVQDALVRVADMAYLPNAKRFAMIVSRFDWDHALSDGSASEQDDRRCRTALRFERVLSARLQSIDLKRKATVLSLLALQFEPATEPPGGTITLIFAGGNAIRLEVECIEGELADLGAVWTTKRRPQHGKDGDDNAT